MNLRKIDLQIKKILNQEKDLQQQLKNIIKQYIQVDLYNEDQLYFFYSNYFHQYDDDYIYYNDQDTINNLLLTDREFSYILDRVHFGDYRLNDVYVKFDRYGNLESFNNLKEHIYIEDIVNNLVSDVERIQYIDVDLYNTITQWMESQQEQEEED